MKKDLGIIIAIALLSLAFFWAPFALKVGKFWGIDFGRQGMNVIVQNFDGLNFLVVAKSLYDPKIIENINNQFMTGNDPIYFSAHFPLYGLIIRVISLVMPMPGALLSTIIISNIAMAAGLWYFFNTILQNKRLAALITIVSLFFPARMLSVRAVGSNEPLFIAFIAMSLALARQKKHLPAAIAGSLAVLTRSPGILLFAGYVLAALASYKLDIKRIIKEGYPYFLMPLALLTLFWFYGVRYGEMTAYFNSGDNLHLFFPPFTIFSNLQSWVSGMWREDIIYLYLFYGIGLVLYLGKADSKCGISELAPAGYGLIYGVILTLVAHRDLGRYALPLIPVVLLGYAEMIGKIPTKYYYLAILLLIPIYLMGWQFVLENIQPINDWGVFL